eukprot:GILJ01000951.1.p2 GENE.GILJ01000951.1~~GILJ01000951.1.p2  ORF type:complete len:572 (-),score=83.96 GILJ01000951.1:140-1855(-)
MCVGNRVRVSCLSSWEVVVNGRKMLRLGVLVALSLSAILVSANVVRAEPPCTCATCYDLTMVEDFVEDFIPAYSTLFTDLNKLLNVVGHSTARRVSGRIRSGESIFDEWEDLMVKGECKKLFEFTDVIGFRVTSQTSADLAAIESAIATKYSFTREKAHQDGYRSVDLHVKVGELTALVQLRTPYMNLWADWRRKLGEKVDNRALQTYGQQVSEYLTNLDKLRSEIPSCPSLLVNSVLNHADEMKDFVENGCFNWEDISATALSPLDDFYEREHSLDDVFVKAADYIYAECNVTYAEVEEYIAGFAPAFRTALSQLKELVGSRGVVTGRLKAAKSMFDNMTRRKADKCNLSDYLDIIGLRVTSATTDAVREVESFLVKNMKFWKGKSPKGDIETLNPETGYRAVHCELEVEGKPVEVQLRTPFATDWADWSHDLVYKGSHRVHDDSDVAKYAFDLANYMLKLDLLRKTIPACPETFATAIIEGSGGNGASNGCFRWSDVGVATQLSTTSRFVQLTHAGTNVQQVNNTTFYALVGVSVFCALTVMVALVAVYRRAKQSTSTHHMYVSIGDSA